LANNALHFQLPIMKLKDVHNKTEKELYKTLTRSLLGHRSEVCNIIIFCRKMLMHLREDF
jgi:hypothetical protein